MWTAISAPSASVDLIVTLIAVAGFLLMFLTGRLSIRRIREKGWWPW